MLIKETLDALDLLAQSLGNLNANTAFEQCIDRWQERAKDSMEIKAMIWAKRDLLADTRRQLLIRASAIARLLKTLEP